MQEKDVVITYETLFELLRIEKNREDLQKIDESFYDDVLLYLSEKKAMLQNHADPSQLLFTDDRVRLEFENIRKILKDLYDRREKKILNLALNRSRTGMTIANTSHMLSLEKAMFSSVCRTLASFREGVLGNVLIGKVPDVDAIERGAVPAEVSHILVPTDSGANFLLESNPSMSRQEGRDAEVESSSFVSSQQNAASGSLENSSAHCTEWPTLALVNETKDLKSAPFSAEPQSTKRVRFLAPIGEIVGPDLQIYGPYNKGDQISLPKELVWILIEKKHVEEI
ncbi:DNA replication complex GINS family protein [Candidatus Woesearchaeota archaeon]|nr:DNA replication complex GINS family protein [Candidatus Woesearchaeota archaeon]